uniref:hypothetical protein n=1 Tax=Jatropha curcas TaxID=180498 RepID=UPI002797E1A4|nr:hypothetical protein QLP06_mgp030 [Jatropha curcas]WFG81209.1 hypothetical protein [Jatropha curcas]
MRLFAIGNYINQRLLWPFHEWLAKLLVSIPMDGTFNQLKPLNRLVPSWDCFSFDLKIKSATDRWPLFYLRKLTQVLFGPEFASAAVHSALGFNFLVVPFLKRKPLAALLVGQPLGYHASWPLFALSYHTTLWCGGVQNRSIQVNALTGMRC